MIKQTQYAINFTRDKKIYTIYLLVHQHRISSPLWTIRSPNRGKITWLRIQRIMTVDKAPVVKSRADDKSLDFDDGCDKTSSAFLSSKRFLSTSPSSSEEERARDDGIDTDSDSGELSDQPEVPKETNGSAKANPENYEERDRETILHQLADLASSEGQGQIILDIIHSTFGFGKSGSNVSGACKSSEYFGNGEKIGEDRRELLVEDLRETLKAVPDSILHLTTGWFRPGDCGRPADQKPDWFAIEKFRRGQKFVRDNMLSILYAELISLLAIYTFDDGLKPLIFFEKTVTPYAAFTRFLSTTMRMRHWYTDDPWKKGTVSWRDMRVVRAIHDASRRKLTASTVAEIDRATVIPNAWCPGREILLKDFSETCEAPVSGQCPYSVGRNNRNRPKGISQTEMAVTQWSFAGCLTIAPKGFGIHHATDEDLEAFCHMWRTLGYQLGIEDEYNLCRGTLQEVQQRSRDLLESWIKPNFREITPEWEHIGRCLISSMAVLVPLITFETTLLHLLEIFDVKMPKLYASLSYKDWILYNSASYFFNYGLRIPGLSGLLSKCLMLVLDRAENYTPKELEAIRIKLSKYPVDSTGTNGNPAVVR